MHDAAYRFYTEWATKINEKYDTYDIVEFGSLIINNNFDGTIRSLFPKANRYFGIDIASGAGVDLVEDAATWIPDQQYDIVICAEVFEHTDQWPAIIVNGLEALRDGGYFLASCASRERPPHSAIDGGPLREGEYYKNVDQLEVERVLEALGVSEFQVIEADGYFGNDDLYFWGIK